MSNADSWLTGYPENVGGGEPVAYEQTQLVADAELATALASLEHKEVIPLDDATAIRLTGKSKPEELAEDQRPYLIRALCFIRCRPEDLTEKRRSLQIWSNGPIIWMNHVGLGHSAQPVARSAIVVWLRDKPRRVFMSVRLMG